MKLAKKAQSRTAAARRTEWEKRGQRIRRMVEERVMAAADKGKSSTSITSGEQIANGTLASLRAWLSEEGFAFSVSSAAGATTLTLSWTEDS